MQTKVLGRKINLDEALEMAEQLSDSARQDTNALQLITGGHALLGRVLIVIAPFDEAFLIPIASLRS